MNDKPYILIIDDITLNIAILDAALAPSYHTRFALSGREALEMIAKEPPDLILLDVMMPEMCGYEVFAQLKAATNTASIPIIFVTANADPRSESEALLAGAVDFIRKPVNIDVLRARVRIHLNQASKQRELEQQLAKGTCQLQY